MKKFLIFLVAFLSLFCIRNKCFGIEFSIGDKSYSIDDEKLITKSSYNSSNIEVDKIDLNKYSNYIVMPQDSSGELSEIRVLFFPTSVVPTISVTLSGSGTIHVGNLYFSPYSTEYYQVSLNVDSNSNITYNSLFFGTLNSGSCNYTTGFNGTGYLYEAYIAAGRDVRVAFPYVSFDLYNYKTSELIKSADSKKDENISDNSSKLKITYEYNTEYTECTISATLIDGAFTDKIFYSNYQPGVTGKLLSKKPFPVSGITVSENQSLFFQAEDKDGNIIANNGLSVNMIGKLSSENFEVNFNKTRGHLYFTPILKNSGYVYNDIYCKIEINDTSSIRVIKDGEYSLDSHTDEFVDYKLIDSGVTWNIINMSLNDQKIKLYFTIKNRNSDTIMITKDYECTVNLFKDSSIDGGIINSGTKDEVSMSPGNDNNFNNLFASLNEKSSIDDLISASKNTFTLFQSAFSILPGWIWALISIFLTVCIVLRILGR